MVEVELIKTGIEKMGVQNVNIDIIMGQLERRRVDWYMGIRLYSKRNRVECDVERKYTVIYRNIDNIKIYVIVGYLEEIKQFGRQLKVVR